MRTRIKICGIRDPAMAEVAVDAGADALGVVLADRSPRRVTLEQARRVVHAVPSGISVVAVVATGEPWQQMLAGWQGPIQLHGPWSEADPVPPLHPRQAMIRAIPWSPEALVAASKCRNHAALLVDGPAGGSGRGFDHEELAPLLLRIEMPMIVAGGLTPAHVGAVVLRLRPYGVDVSSGVESAPGIKDVGAIRSFCAAVREADSLRA